MREGKGHFKLYRKGMLRGYVEVLLALVKISFIYLFIYLFKVDKFTKLQYAYIHKSSQTNWLIKVSNITKKSLLIFLIKTKEKGNKMSKTGL